MSRLRDLMRPTALLVVAVSATGGCGDSGGSAQESTRCSDIWVEGRVLPENYAGCTEDGKSDALVTQLQPCGELGGPRNYFTHRNFFAVNGETIMTTTNGKKANSSKSPAAARC